MLVCLCVLVCVQDASTPVRNNPDELAYLRRTANEMLEKMDTNNDGKLSFEEFSTCFDSLVAASKANSADNVQHHIARTQCVCCLM